ncbi:protection of telomeres protein 1b-like isoform X3 [Chenopodium quinoa]|nr:protection of telomeres protein 1b-like isoform X3 [Chenopodium quinoa]
MKTHNKETYALFNKKFSSFALYEGKHGENYNPYQISSMFWPRNQDTMFVDGLRKWVDNFQLDSVSEESVLLRQIKDGQCYDLVCKVLHVSQVDQEEWMLFVWDGSDAPPPQLLSELHTEKENPLPLQLEPQPLAREALCKFPTIGTILRVSVDQKNVKLNISSVSAGRWIKFINLMFKVHEGLWCGVLTSSTKVRFLPNEHLVILERQRLVIHMLSFFWCMVHFDLVNIMYLRFVAVSLSNLHYCMVCVIVINIKRLYICFIRNFEKRLSSKLDQMPFTSFPWPCRITEVDDKVEGVPLVTLMDVMTYPQVTGKYKCIVRVVAALPWTIQDFRSPDGTYRIRLTLEDPTGRIHAYLFAEDGEVFFEGNPPMDALIRKWNTLLGVAEVDSGGVIENAPRNPPWVLCCIKSYYVDKNDVWGSRKYRIFDTKLVC